MPGQPTDIVKLVLAIVCAILSLVLIALGVKKYAGVRKAREQEVTKELAEKAGPQLPENT